MATVLLRMSPLAVRRKLRSPAVEATIQNSHSRRNFDALRWTYGGLWWGYDQWGLKPRQCYGETTVHAGHMRGWEYSSAASRRIHHSASCQRTRHISATVLQDRFGGYHLPWKSTISAGLYRLLLLGWNQRGGRTSSAARPETRRPLSCIQTHAETIRPTTSLSPVHSPAYSTSREAATPQPTTSDQEAERKRRKDNLNLESAVEQDVADWYRDHEIF